jgi:two-component system cell cycle sensor histidine kinase/response regulator CckA
MITPWHQMIIEENQAIDSVEEDLKKEVAARTQAEAKLRLVEDRFSALENRLRQAEKMEAVGQLAAGIAHDFNNILTIIQGHSTMLLSAENLDSETAESLRQVTEAADRATALTRQLLAFSRRQMMQPKVLQLNSLIQQMSDMLRRLIGEQIVLQWHCPEDLSPIYADSCNIEQILLNLAVNARDAMPKGGQLVIKVADVAIDAAAAAKNPEARAGNFVCMSVTDTGCGMDAATQSRIFEPFFTTKDIGRGTGVGLSTVYGIVKQHEGWIEVSSVLGHGTTFKTFLPVSSSMAPKDEAKPTFSENLGGDETILIVEDQDLIRDLVRTVLRKYGYRTLEASNGVEALKVWEDHRDQIDLLLTDMVMPAGISGKDLAKRLVAEQQQLKVVYTSGYNTDLLGQEFHVKKDTSFLQKPYQAQFLAKTVRDCLDAPARSHDTQIVTVG